MDFDATLEVHNIERRTDVPMRQWREVELAYCANRLVDDVVAFVAADGDTLVRQIGNLQQQSIQLFFCRADAAIQLANAVANLLHLGNEWLALRLVFHAANLLADTVALGFEVFDLGKQRAA